MSETMQDKSEQSGVERRITARVVSTRMDKSASVEITRMVRHSLYGKYLRRRTKLLVHDEDNQCREGDVVRISQCRPISRRKSWRVVEIVGHDEASAGEPEAGAEEATS
jgi:small subunit ribosomal protein S17